MEDKEEIEVDVVGVEKQRREAILNSGRYVNFSIVVGEEYTEPVVQADVKANPLMMASAIACLRQVEKTIVKQSGIEVKLLADQFEKNMSSKTIDASREEE